MKKQIVLLSLSLLILVAMGGVLWFVNSRPDSPSTSSPTQTQEGKVALINGEILSMDVTLPFESYTITKNQQAYGITGHDSKYLSQQSIQDCIVKISNLNCEIVAENSADKNQYGLLSPRATVEVNTDNGTTTLEIGNTSISNGTYVTVKGSETIYHLNSAVFETIIKGSLTFVDKTITSPPDKAAAAQNIRVLPQKAAFSGKNYKAPLMLEKKDMTDFEKEYSLYSYVITSNNNKEADKEIILTTLASLFEITAKDIFAYNPTPKQLSDCGFDTPYATANFSWQDKSGNITEVLLKVALDEQGRYFVTKNDCPIIYLVDKESLPWLDMQYEDIVSRLALVPDLNTLSALSIKGAGVDEKYIIDTKGEDISVTCRDKAVDTQRFKTFYEQLISLPGEQFATKKPAADAKKILSITYTYKNGTSDTVEMIEDTPLLVYLCVNGSFEFLTNAKYPSIIIENSKILNGSDSLTPLY